MLALLLIQFMPILVQEQSTPTTEQESVLKAGSGYFPRHVGDGWVYRKISGGPEIVMSIEGKEWHNSVLYYRFKNFPGGETGLSPEPGILLGFYPNSPTLRSWTYSWLPFLKFASNQGDSYVVNLPYPRLTNLLLQVKYPVTIYNHILKQTFTDCIQFDFKYYGGPVPPQPLRSYVFAKKFGLIQWQQKVNGATFTYVLQSATIGGKKVGRVPFETLDSGAVSSHPTTLNNVLAIANQIDWVKFQTLHGKCYGRAIDWTKETVVAVLAGQRPKTGYSLWVKGVRWDYYVTGLDENQPALLRIQENVPGSGVVTSPQVTYPYCILVLKTKLPADRIVHEWLAVPYGPPVVGGPLTP